MILLKSKCFERYRILQKTDPVFLDAQEVAFSDGTASIVNGKPIAQYDLANGISGFSSTAVEGNSYFLGEDTGLTHTYKDTTVVNGQLYYYAVCAYDRGVDSIEIYPSENAITVSQTLRGGTILPSNVVEIYPGKQVLGYEPATASAIEQFEGNGYGTVNVEVLNPELVPDNHQFIIDFVNPTDSVHAQAYRLIDETIGDTIFIYGSDFSGAGIGPVGSGLLPVISTSSTVQIDTISTGFTSSFNK